MVYNYQEDKAMPMYDLDKVKGKDPYEMFLGGPLSLVTIENPNATSAIRNKSPLRTCPRDRLPKPITR